MEASVEVLGGWHKFETLPQLLPVPGGGKEQDLYAARIGPLIGVERRPEPASLNRSPIQGSDKPARAAIIFNHNGPPPRSLAAY